MLADALALVRARPGFRRLALGEVVSMVGDWFTYVAVSVLVLGSSQGLLGVALVLVAHTLPRALAAPFAGWLSDRVERRRMLVAFSCVRGVCVLGMLAAAHQGSMAALQCLLVARMASGAFVDAAASAALPGLVLRAELGLANTIRAAYWSVLFALSVAAGGLATAALGSTFALAVDALTFFVAALVFTGVRARRGEGRAAQRRSHPGLRLLRRRPDVLRAALGKAPVALANGAAWVGLHAVSDSWAEVALGVGLLHGARAVGTGVGPLAWHANARLGASPRGVAASIAFTFVGVALFSWAQGPLGWVGASFLWGVGVGANWVVTSTRTQILTPDALLGRVSALDIAAQTTAQCLGGLLAAALIPTLGVTSALGLSLVTAAGLWALGGYATRPGRRAALAAVGATLLLPCMLAGAPLAVAQGLDVDRELASRSVTDDDFGRRVLYSWTTRDQVERLRSDRRLLVATASSGQGPTPFNRALAVVARRGDVRGAIARALLEDERIRRRRYAWTSPFGTAVPRGPRSYGRYLVRMTLRPEAWLGRFEPGRPDSLRFVTTSGRPVALSEVAARPERIGAILHVRRPPAVPYAFREYVVVAEAMVKSWSLATDALRQRVEAEARLLRHLARGPFARPVPGLAHPTWSRRAANRSLPDRYRATLAFDVRRHRITRANLLRIAEALERHSVAGAPLVHHVGSR